MTARKQRRKAPQCRCPWRRWRRRLQKTPTGGAGAPHAAAALPHVARPAASRPPGARPPHPEALFGRWAPEPPGWGGGSRGAPASLRGVATSGSGVPDSKFAAQQLLQLCAAGLATSACPLPEPGNPPGGWPAAPTELCSELLGEEFKLGRLVGVEIDAQCFQ